MLSFWQRQIYAQFGFQKKWESMIIAITLFGQERKIASLRLIVLTTGMQHGAAHCHQLSKQRVSIIRRVIRWVMELHVRRYII